MCACSHKLNGINLLIDDNISFSSKIFTGLVENALVNLLLRYLERGIITKREKMKIRSFLSLYILIFSFFVSAVFGQFTKDEIQQRESLEEFLLNAEIVKSEDVGEGVTKPLKLYLSKGDKEAKGVWKNPEGIQEGYLEGWRYEIAAYRMDKLLGLNMIPPTVERELEGKKGSLQYWVTSEFSLLEVMEENIEMPASTRELREKGKYLARVFDSLIANEDRTQQNILYTKDWRTILIDHSRSFRSSEKFTKNLMYGKNGIIGDNPFRRLPREFVEKIERLDHEKIRSAVRDYLTEKEIEAILIRKKLILDEIKAMIEEKGEAAVLY